MSELFIFQLSFGSEMFEVVYVKSMKRSPEGLEDKMQSSMHGLGRLKTFSRGQFHQI
jgi:hypothetical protein